MGRLIRGLADGPLDVVGDVHGELGALSALVERLGYDAHGRHPAGRRLVFVGDLSDRGPDSPGVIRWVQELVQSGQAQAIIGNHELNLLRRERKNGNHWFYGDSYDPRHPEYGYCATIKEHGQEPILSFFRSLPVALERDDLRVVHAAWIDAAIDRCRSVDEPVDVAYKTFEIEVRETDHFATLKGHHDQELARLGGRSIDEADPQRSVAAIGPFEEFIQTANPIRVITSGVERTTKSPFTTEGKLRFVDRVAWWREYTGDVPVLFGHYWRWWDPSVHAKLSKGEPHLFEDDQVGPFMAEHHRAFCVDFSVGSRFKQRHRGHEAPFHGRLAAMRWPERELVFDADEPRDVNFEEASSS